jgi:hypothetical protein
MSTRAPQTNRHHGGPGSSHQRSDLPDPTEQHKPEPGTSTSRKDSRVSGGGGERDSHHTHDPALKGGHNKEQRRP